MQWYLLKTWVGREEELVNEIRRTVPPHMYKECFVIYQKRVWRKQQRSVVHVELLFPGCVFLTCEKVSGEKPDSADLAVSSFGWLESIPELARLITCGSLTILPMMKEDADFLESISGEGHMVELSYVVTGEDGKICNMSNPLRIFQGQIERCQFKKRYAMVRHRLWGENQVFVLGIILKEDAGQKLFYENYVNMEALTEVPG